MKTPFHNPFCKLSVQYTWMEFAVFAHLVITFVQADDFRFEGTNWYGLQWNPRCLYRSRNNGLLSHLVSTKHYHFVRFRFSSHLYVLYMCLYVRAYN